MEELKVINEQEVLGKSFRIYGTAEEPLFLAKDVASLIELTNVTDMVSRVDPCEVTKLNLGGLQGECNFLTEDGLYEVLMQSRKPIAKEFKKKVKEILKDIRKTGGHVSNDELFINTYLPYADESTREMFKTTLATVRKQNEIIENQKKEIEHKEEVIIGLVDDIELAEKRQILNRVVRYNHANYRERWSLLYREFENKYHIDLKRRVEKYNKDNKPKCKTTVEYIDRIMNKIPELYEIATKLFENDIDNLVKEMYETAM